MSKSKPNHEPPIFHQPTARRSANLTVRLTEAQNEFLTQLAQSLGRDKADLVREAIDVWVQSRHAN